MTTIQGLILIAIGIIALIMVITIVIDLWKLTNSFEDKLFVVFLVLVGLLAMTSLGS